MALGSSHLQLLLLCFCHGPSMMHWEQDLTHPTCILRIILTFQGTKLDLLLYIADNMAHFPYSIQEEPLFVIHHIDTILSVTGTNLLHSFKEVGSQ